MSYPGAQLQERLALASAMRLISAFFFALVMILVSAADVYADDSDKAGEPDIVGFASIEQGAWRTKIQQVFDPAVRTLLRRMYTIWDTEPSGDLDFIWIPDQPQTDKPGRISGSGHLLWRIKGRPAYDRSSIHAEYRGTLREGRIEGHGTYLDHTGLFYEGEWKAGLMDGQGRLALSNGDEYVGEFHLGKANGSGRYIDTTGEIYGGPFIEGRRHGRGTTTLPSGYLYTSYWTHGRESETSRRVRLAQAPGGGLPGGADDIRIGITLDKRLPASVRNEWKELKRGDLTYTVVNAANALSIKPDNNRLISMWKGDGDIGLTAKEERDGLDTYGVLSLIRAQLVPLNLMVEVQNRSVRQIQVSGIYFQVASSVSALEPAIQLSRRSSLQETDPDDSWYYRPFYFVENFGWSSARDAKLQFRFVNPTSPVNASPMVTRNIGDIERSVKLSFEDELRAAGVHLDALEDKSPDVFKCKSTNRAACLREIIATGVFGSLGSLLTADDTDIVLGVSGRLEYVWQDSTGAANKRSSPVNIQLKLGELPMTAEGSGGEEREIIARRAQMFKLDARDYRISISYQTTVAARNTARLVVPIEAEKSSAHDFNIVVQLADGREIRSRPVNLLYYRPRWFALDFFAREEDHAGAGKYYIAGEIFGQPQLKDRDVCWRACASEPRCLAISFDRWQRLCSLHTSVKELRLDPRYEYELKEGTPKPSISSVHKIIQAYRNMSFPGFGYLIDVDATFEECANRCMHENTCVAFTLKKKANTCSLFRSVDEHSLSWEADSGIIRQP